MPTPRKPEPHRDRAARLAINALAVKVTRAQAHDIPVVLVLRTRPVRKLRGKIESRRVDPYRKLTGSDGESNLLVRVAGEEVALEHVSEIRRQRDDT